MSATDDRIAFDHDEAMFGPQDAEPIVLPAVCAPTFGDGWLSRNAADLIRIAVLFGGFDEATLVRRVAVAQPRGVTNCATVGRILDDMLDEHRIAHGEQVKA